MSLSHHPIHGGMIWEASEKLNTSINNIIDFSSNINPLGPPEKLISTLINSLDLVRYYPDPNYRELRLALADIYGVDAENIMVGNGATEIIHVFAQAFISAEDRVLIPIPTFDEYRYAVEKVGAKIVYIGLRSNMHIDVDAIISRIESDKVKAVFLCNPNNPTGVFENQSDLLRLLDKASERNVLVFLDESFTDFVVSKKPYSLIKVVNNYSNLFIVKSLTKILGIPGLRIGIGIGSKSITTRLNRYRITWSVSTITERAVLSILSELNEYLRVCREFIKRERNFIIKQLSKVDSIRVVSGDANFLFIYVGNSGYTSLEIAEYLLKRHILIRDCSTFTGLTDSYIRVAIRRHNENIALINSLKELVKNID